MARCLLPVALVTGTAKAVPCRSTFTIISMSGGTSWAAPEHSQVGDEKCEARTGDFIFGPRGVPHSFAFPPGAGGCLSVWQPAGTMEDFFRQLKTPVWPAVRSWRSSADEKFPGALQSPRHGDRGAARRQDVQRPVESSDGNDHADPFSDFRIQVNQCRNRIFREAACTQTRLRAARPDRDGDSRALINS